MLLILLLFFIFVKPAFADTTYKVTKVIDGDTINVSINGKNQTVRLLGIDTPESVDPRKPVQCFALEASKKLKNFVLGKNVILVSDSTQGDKDKYGRLLRYMYLPNSTKTFINGEMVKQGFAFSYRQYPTKFLNKFNSFETYARNRSLGLWNSCPLNVSPTKTPVKTYTVPKTTNQTAPAQKTNNGTCDCSKSCTAMSSCSEAYYQLNTCGCSARDGDSDGIPCESLCR